MRARLMIASVAPLMAMAVSAHAAPACTADALNALSITDLKVTDAKPMPATATAPAFCQVTGVVVTRGEGAPDGSARFLMQLPDAWKQRFVFFGVGGNAGTLGASVNGVDRATALGKGYVTVLTDTGHVGDGTTAKWARKPDGSVDQAKMTDFLFRAAHDVGVYGKAFAQAYYAAPIQHAYFDGCSTGGRMALASTDHYPDDYSGVIAGDSAMDFNLNLARINVQKAVLKGAQSFIPEELLAKIDARVTARCDAIDGVKDGLVQDPSRCPVRAKDLLCKKGETDACLNADQVAVLTAYTSPLRDKHGRVAYPGWAITNMSGNATSNYTTAKTAPNRSMPSAPWGADGKEAPRGWALGRESLAYYLGMGIDVDMNKVDIENNVVGDELLANVKAVMTPGEGGDASKLLPFVAKGGKLILYHGASDPSIPAQRTINLYRDLAAKLGGDAKTQANVRLFLVPGMHHCTGGVGPDQFDTLTALENWVEKGEAPASIPASTRPAAAVQHNLPLCPYPQQARYSGTGDVTQAANWSCKAPAKVAAKSEPAKKKAG